MSTVSDAVPAPPAIAAGLDGEDGRLRRVARRHLVAAAVGRAGDQPARDGVEHREVPVAAGAVEPRGDGAERRRRDRLPDIAGAGLERPRRAASIDRAGSGDRRGARGRRQHDEGGRRRGRGSGVLEVSCRPERGRSAKLAAMLPRLNRLFAADGRCFDVAVDHGFFGEGSFLSGIEDIAAAVAKLVAAGPDAIQLSPGQARHLQAPPRPQAGARAAHRRRQRVRARAARACCSAS